MYRVMYKDAHQYVADRDGVFYWRTAISIERQFRTVNKAALGMLQRTDAVGRIASLTG